jgi:hypothetical protein
MGPIIKDAVPEAQPALLDMFADVYEAWPVRSPLHPEPQHPENERHYTDGLASLMASIPGGLDKIIRTFASAFPAADAGASGCISQSDQIDSSPAMQAALIPIVRDELIPQFVAQNRRALERGQNLTNWSASTTASACMITIGRSTVPTAPKWNGTITFLRSC